jgi:uroporphyrinogen decarboxylase
MVEVKATYGNEITFLGGIDIRSAMQGEPAAVEAEAQRRIDGLAPAGGYILAPANHLQRDVPPRNLFLLYDYARTAQPAGA